MLLLRRMLGHEWPGEGKQGAIMFDFLLWLMGRSRQQPASVTAQEEVQVVVSHKGSRRTSSRDVPTVTFSRKGISYEIDVPEGVWWKLHSGQPIIVSVWMDGQGIPRARWVSEIKKERKADTLTV